MVIIVRGREGCGEVEGGVGRGLNGGVPGVGIGLGLNGGVPGVGRGLRLVGRGFVVVVVVEEGGGEKVVMMLVIVLVGAVLVIVALEVEVSRMTVAGTGAAAGGV